MLYFERVEAKLNVALEYIKKLDEYALTHNKKSLHNSTQKVLKKIKEI